MASSSGGQSRLFLVVVLGLVGLLMVGLVAIAGLVVYTRFLAPTASPTTVAVTTPSPRPTVAATATTPPATAATPTTGEGAPTPTTGEGAPTPTRVIQAGTPAPEGATPTVAATATPQGGGQLAPTGFGPMGAVAGGLVLVLVIVGVRRLRLSAGT